MAITEKTLRLRIEGDTSNAQAALANVNTALAGTTAVASSLKTVLNTVTGQFEHDITIAGASLARLKAISDKILGSSLAPANQKKGALAQDPIKEAQARRDASTAIYKQETQQAISELNRRLALERSIRINGATAIQTIELQAAHREEVIRRNLATKLLEIENKLKQGTLTSRSQANAARAAAVNASQAQINANRVTLEASQATDRYNQSLSQTITQHKSLATHIIEIIGLYKVFNYIFNSVANAIKSIPKIGIELETTKSALIASTGSLAGMATVFSFLNREAARTGIAISTLRETFRNFHASTSIAGESLKATWKMFTNMNTVITALHLPADKASGVFLALAQIFNKTKVQSEELVKQLGNLLPGAFAAFAKANAISTLDLVKNMKAGTVLAHDTILNFTEFYAERFKGAFAVASQGLNSSIGRMQTAFTLLGESIYEATSGPLISAVRGLTNLATWFKTDAEGINIFGKALSVLGTTLTFVLGASLIQKAQNFFFLSTSLRTATGVIVTTTAATRALAASMAFLSSPAVIIAGIGMIGKALYDLTQNENELRDSIDETLRAFAKPIPANASLEEKISITAENDPFIKEERRKQDVLVGIIAETREKINRIAKLSPWQKDIPFSPLRLLIDQLNKDVDRLNKQKVVVEAALGGITDAITAADAANAKPPVDFSEARANLLETRYDKEGKAVEAAISRFTRANAVLKKEADSIVASFKAPMLPPPGFDQAQYDEALGYLKDYKTGLKDATEAARLQAKGDTGLENIYEIKAATVAKQAEQLKANSAILVSAIEKAKDDYLTATKVSESKGIVVSEFEQLNKLADFDRKILAEKRKLSQDIIKLNADAAKEQEASSKRQINNFERAYAVIQKIESAGNKRAVSPTGALGLMQVQPSTLAKPGFGMEGLDVDAKILELEKKARVMHQKLTATEKEAMANYAEANSEVFAEFGRNYYKKLVEHFKGDLVKAAAAYNAGIGTVSRGGELPKETQDYVKRFESLYDEKGTQNHLNLITNISTEQANLNSLQIEGNKLNNVGLAETAKLEKERLDQLNNLKIELLAAQGLTQDAEIERLKLEYTKRRVELENAGNKVSISLLDTLYKRKLVTLELTGLTSQLAKAESEAQLAETRINIARKSGLLTIGQAGSALLEIRSRAIEVENKLLLALREQVALHQGDVGLAQQLLDLEQRRADKQAEATAFRVGIEQEGGDEFSFVTDYNTKMEQLQAFLEAEKAAILGNAEEVAAQKAAIEEKYSFASQKLTANLWQGMAATGAKTFESITSIMIKMYGAQSKQARIAFIAYKAMKAAEIAIEGAKATMKAYSEGGPYLGPVLAAMAAAMTVAQIAQVVSQPVPAAHGGLDNVPSEQTYLLDKGERVLSPGQNKDMTRLAKDVREMKKDREQVAAAPAQPQNIRIINAVDPSLFNEYLGSDDGEKVVMNIVRRNKG